MSKEFVERFIVDEDYYTCSPSYYWRYRLVALDLNNDEQAGDQHSDKDRNQQEVTHVLPHKIPDKSEQ